jgi:hypothetical protein
MGAKIEHGTNKSLLAALLGMVKQLLERIVSSVKICARHYNLENKSASQKWKHASFHTIP